MGWGLCPREGYDGCGHRARRARVPRGVRRRRPPRLWWGSLRGLLLALGAVLGTALLAIARPGGVEGAADHVIADAGEVLDAAAADQHDAVLLEVVAHTGDVRGDLDLAGEADARHLAKRRVRLLRGGRVHAHADTAPLGRTLERRRLRLLDDARAALADQLLDGGHCAPEGMSGVNSSGRSGRAHEDTPRPKARRRSLPALAP